MEQHTLELIKIIGAILVGVVGAGGLGAGVFTYFATKPKNHAEAQKLQADVVVTFADGWKGYAEKIEKALAESEARSTKKITELEERIEHTKQEYDAKIKLKEAEITALSLKYTQDIEERDKKISKLTNEVSELRHTIKNVQQIQQETQTV